MVNEKVTIFTKVAKNTASVEKRMFEDGDIYLWSNRDALIQLNMLIQSGIWGTSKSTKDLLKYIDMKAPEAAKILGKSPNTIRAQRSQASDLLECLLGKDIIDKCISPDKEDIAEAIKRIESVKNMHLVDKFMVSDIVVPAEYPKKNYKLEDCSKEIEVLAELSNLHRERLLSEVNPKKMAYLFKVLGEPNILKEDDERTFNTNKAELLFALVDAEKAL